MAATTTPRRTLRRASPLDFAWSYVAGAVCVNGSIGGVALDGTAAPPGPTVKSIGRVTTAYGESAAVGESVTIDQGIFAWAQTGAPTITIADIGSVVSVVDNQTVSLDPSLGEPLGVIVDVDTDGVWVFSGFGVGAIEAGGA